MNNDNDDKRLLFEHCRLQAKRIVNPIVDWKNENVWDFLTAECAPPVNPLYAEGWSRVGCIGCPLAGTKTQMQEFERWPAYEKLYLNSFARMLEMRIHSGKETEWQNQRDVMNWFLDNGILTAQIDLFEEEDYE